MQFPSAPAAFPRRLLQAAVDADGQTWNSSSNSSTSGSHGGNGQQVASWVTFSVSISDLVSNRQELLGMATNGSMMRTLHEGMQREWATSPAQVLDKMTLL
jgi:hypothetical protein